MRTVRFSFLAAALVMMCAAWSVALAATPPVTCVIASGGSVTFDATTEGATYYGWSRNGEFLGISSPQFTIENASALHAGSYQVTIVTPAGASYRMFHVRVARSNAVLAWGDNSFGQCAVPVDLRDVVDLSAGQDHTLALRSDGTVVAWGLNDHGQCAVPVGLSGVVQVAAGANHSVALKADGSVVAWGSNSSGQCAVPAGLNGVGFVAAGGAHTIALKYDGTMVAWGDNTYGQIDIPYAIRPIRTVSAGLRHNVAITSSEGMVAWGDNEFGQSTPPRNTYATVVHAGENFTAYLMSGGQLWYFGKVVPAMPFLSYAVALSGRALHGLALRPDGSVAAWGPNVSGERDIPPGVGNVQQVAAGRAHSVVLLSGIPPTLTLQPVAQTAAEGSSITFTVAASGAATYQWLHDGVALTEGGRFSGVATGTLTVTGVQATDAGSYTARLSNPFGEVTSQPAALTVRPLIASAQGTVLANSDASQVTLSVSVSGAGPFTYQWYRGQSGDLSTPVSGAISATLTVAQTTAAEPYWVRVSNGVAQADSVTIPVGKWQVIDPMFGASPLYAVTYGGGKHVVVGAGVAHSATGQEWQVGAIESGANLRTVVHDGMRFVAAGVGGQVFASSDGAVWTKLRAADVNADTDLPRAAAVGNGNVVFLGASQVLTSTDGSSWAWHAINANGETIVLRSIAFGAGRFVAVGASSANFGSPCVFSSLDGVNWTQATVPLTSPNVSYKLGDLQQVYYLGGRFVALGMLAYTSDSNYVLSSTDGVTWNAAVASNLTVSPEFMVAGNGQLVSADLRTSADGITWSTSRGVLPPGYPRSLGFGNGLFFYLSYADNERYSSVATSSDLNNWTTRIGFGVPEYIAYGAGRFVGVARENGRYSLDGLTWATTSNWSYSVATDDVCYGNGLFVARDTTGREITHYTSNDGLAWTARRAEALGGVRGFTKIRYLNGQWVGLSSSFGISTSVDGVNWTTPFRDANHNYSDIAYGAGRYVSVGAGQVVASIDGLNWTSYPQAPTLNFHRVAGGGGMFVATDGSGLWSSPDGAQWTSRAKPVKSSGSYTGFLSSLEYADGQFVATYGSDVLLSANGIDWQVLSGVLPPPVNGNYFTGRLVVAEGKLWAVGSTFAGPPFWLRAPRIVSPPAITASPADVVIASGSSATLTVVASGSGLTYQWYRGLAGDVSNPIAGATAASYVTPTLTQTGHYWVRITNTDGVASSSTVTVAIGSAPAITTHPVDLDILAGSTPNLTVIATGNPALSYQWYRGESGDTSRPVAGATGSSYTPPTDGAQAVRYWVRVSNTLGAADSRAVIVTPWFARSALTNKSIVGLAYGAGRWVAQGFSDGDYFSDDGANWTKTTNQLGGQSGGSVAWGNGIFVAVDSDTVGALWTSLDGNAWRKIFVPGASVQFTHVAQAGGYLFALGKEGQFATSIDGANWTLRNVGGSVYLRDVAYGNGRYVMSATLTVHTSTDLNSWQSFAVAEGDIRIDALSFGRGKFVAIGAANLGRIMTSTDGASWTVRYTYSSNGVYDVAFNGSRFAVSTLDHLIVSRDGVDWGALPLPGTSAITSGSGAFLAAGQFGAWQSAADELLGPVITAQPTQQSVASGGSATFRVAAVGGTLTYRWQKDGVDLSGAAATAATLTLTDVTSADAGLYSVVVTNDIGAVVSEVARLTVASLPQIISPPQSQTIKEGEPTYLEVLVGGDAPTTYAWYRDNAPIAGASDARLRFNAVQASDAGSYTVKVTNAAGSVTSAPAVLTVATVPVITLQPATQSTTIGVPVSFTLTSTGTGVFHYQWETSPAGSDTWSYVPLNASYTGVMSQTLTVVSPAAADSGRRFRCIVMDDVGLVRSQVATLTVNLNSQTITFAGPVNQPFSTAPITLVASASSGLPVSFAIDSGPASVDGDKLTLTGTGSVTVRASQGGDASYAAAANVVRTFTVTASFDFWQLNAFSSAERNDPTVSGPNADPDADGIPNLIEYALGLDARSASVAGVPIVALDSGKWSFTYTRPVDRSDLVYSVEQSTDLIHWNITDVSHIRVSIADGVETWRATYPTASASACFFRLVVTR